MINEYNINIPNFNIKMKRTNKQDFSIPSYKDYNKLVDENYKLTELRLISKYYKLKSFSNKKQNLTNIYKHLYLSFITIKIQNMYRKYIYNKFIKLHGPAYYKRELCVNDTDFYTLDPIKNINNIHFISFKDKNDFIYGCDVKSLYTLISKDSNTTNPYTREPLSNDIKENLMQYIKVCRFLKIPLILKDDTEVMTLKKRLQLKTINIFQKIDALGNYTNPDWFNNLSHFKMVVYVRELYDIWVYRAQLSDETKLQIVPGNLNPFRHIDLSTIQLNSSYTVKSCILNIIDVLISSGVDESSKSLGAYYCLAALTLVNNEAAEAMPWLYQSVMHH